MKLSIPIFSSILILNSLAFANQGGDMKSDQKANQNGQSQASQQPPLDWRVVRSYTEPSGFYIGLTGMYAVPSETGLGTFIHSLGYINDDGGVNSRITPSKAHYRPAGGIEIGYDFGGFGYKLEGSYFYLHNSKRNSHHSGDPVTFGNAFFNIGTPLIPGEELPSAILKYTLDQADIKFGHRLTTNACFFEFTPFIGIRYAYLKHDLPFTGGHVKSRYSGGGPLLGFDLIYKLYKGILLLGEFDAALLMGSVKSSSSLNLGGTNRFKSPSNTRIVSNLEGRLGLAYDWLLCNRSSLRMEAGYEMNYYIGPFDMVISHGPFSGPFSVQRIADLETTNFAYSGPYLKLTWHM